MCCHHLLLWTSTLGSRCVAVKLGLYCWGWNESVHSYTFFFVSDSQDAILIRLSLKAAMGDNAVSVINNYKAFIQQWLHIYWPFANLKRPDTINIYAFFFQYPWNSNELYLFRANIAHALNQFYSLKNMTPTFTLVLTSTKSHRDLFFPTGDSCCSVWIHRAENVLAYKETPRISFYILVMDPNTPSKYIPKAVVEEAIRSAIASFLNFWNLKFLHSNFNFWPPTFAFWQRPQVRSRTNQPSVQFGWLHPGVRGYCTNPGCSCGAGGGSLAGRIRGGHGNRCASGGLPHRLRCPGAQKVS